MQQEGGVNKMKLIAPQEDTDWTTGNRFLGQFHRLSLFFAGGLEAIDYLSRDLRVSTPHTSRRL